MLHVRLGSDHRLDNAVNYDIVFEIMLGHNNK